MYSNRLIETTKLNIYLEHHKNKLIKVKHCKTVHLTDNILYSDFDPGFKPLRR